MGANVDSSKMPEYLVKAFVGAFIRLKKYRIFWRIGTTLKLEGVDLESLPSHINVTTYLPQSDLLGRLILFPECRVDCRKPGKILYLNVVDTK
jgi:hypothetical protein